MMPISDEQAKIGQEVVKALGGLGSFVERTLGTLPQDLVGYLGGDWLRFRRIENIAKLMARTKERLEAWNTEPCEEPPSLSLTLPILRKAADESRDELQDLWARLLAATIDPSKTKYVRQGFIEAITKMDPLDAVVFLHLNKQIKRSPGYSQQEWEKKLSTDLRVSKDEVKMSIHALIELKLVDHKFSVEPFGYMIPLFGQKFLDVVSDTRVASGDIL